MFIPGLDTAIAIALHDKLSDARQRDAPRMAEQNDIHKASIAKMTPHEAKAVATKFGCLHRKRQVITPARHTHYVTRRLQKHGLINIRIATGEVEFPHPKSTIYWPAALMFN
jgi:hypothetical protein